jgi:hypothetical protein
VNCDWPGPTGGGKNDNKLAAAIAGDVVFFHPNLAFIAVAFHN